MANIGIMGGTFDPIHIGHLRIAEDAREQFGLSQVFFMPCGNPYMKNDHAISAIRHRMEMTRLAIASHPQFFLSEEEASREGRTYTYETLERLQAAHPNTTYYFILGADSLFSMENWRYPERIFASCIIVAAARNGTDLARIEQKKEYLQLKYHADIRILESCRLDISSSQIRTLCAQGQSIRYYVPEEVERYIKEQGLYIADS